MPKGSSASASAGRSSYLSSTAYRRWSLIVLALLQRLVDVRDQKPNENGLYEVCAGDSSHRAQSQKVDENKFTRSMLCVPHKVCWRAAFAGLSGKCQGEESTTFFVDDIEEEYLAVLAIKIEVMRWLTVWFPFCRAPRHRDSGWSIPSIWSLTYSYNGPVVRTLQYSSSCRLRMVFGTKNSVDVHG